jgi:polyisoprenoid-binding protein YceI
MTRYDASSAECFVFTYKEGLLSAVAHDLKIRVGSFQIDVAEDFSSVEATFDPMSLQVECARVEGRDAPGTLSKRDRRTIEDNIVKEVLEAKRYKEVRYASSHVQAKGEGYRIDGTLTLHGQSHSMRVPVRREGDRYVAEVRLHQPDFGIKPYRAALGTLKIRPDVDVRISVPVG